MTDAYDYGALLPSSAPPPLVNEYDTLVVERDREEQTRIRANLLDAYGHDPEKTARAVRLSKQTGIPVDTVVRNFAAVETSAAVERDFAAIRGHAGLEKWIQDPVNARVTQGDYEKLGLVERAVRGVAVARTMDTTLAKADVATAVLDEVVAAVDATALAQRSPEKLEDFIASLLPTGLVVHFLPSDEARQQAEALGSAEQLSEAPANGGAVVVPLQKYLVAGRALHGVWRNNIRFKLESLSLNDTGAQTDVTAEGAIADQGGTPSALMANEPAGRRTFAPSLRQANSQQDATLETAQAVLPPTFFGRPPVLPPRPLTPLDELPTGSSGGTGARRPFPSPYRDQLPEGVPCTYCGQPTTKKAPGPDQLHLEHVIPRKQGGNNSRENSTPSCRTCNLEKGPRTPEQWYNSRGGVY